jgi:hypothetical protein
MPDLPYIRCALLVQVHISVACRTSIVVVILFQISTEQKVPKCDILDNSNVHDFYSIKFSWGGGDFI